MLNWNRPEGLIHRTEDDEEITVVDNSVVVT
jgi:hypothetical protein